MAYNEISTHSDHAAVKGKAKSRHSFPMFLTAAMLVAIGMTNLYSAGSISTFFNSQVQNLIISFVAFIIFGWIVPLRLVNTYAYVFFAFTTFSLLVVLILGHTAGGGQRWILLGASRFQPSEFAKLAMCLAVAKFFYTKRSLQDFSLRELWPILLVSVAVFVLIFKQPDLGTAGVCLLIAIGQLLFIRIQISYKTIFFLTTFTIVGMIIGWNFFLHSYQKMRVLTLINPGLDPTGTGYNSLQSLVAVGSGGLFGKGFFKGTQTQLQFLPARHTDFIFSVFAEEHGFWGGVIVFILFSTLTYIALEIARESKDTFNSLLGVGIATLIFVEFTINIAMVLGLFPVVGMPLPFFSYGGSSLLTIWTSLGMLVAIDRENTKLMSKNKFL